MNDYFKRLIDHPGVPYGILFTLLGGLAGLGNEKLSYGWLIGALIMGAFCWIPILLSNRK